MIYVLKLNTYFALAKVFDKTSLSYTSITNAYNLQQNEILYVHVYTLHARMAFPLIFIAYKPAWNSCFIKNAVYQLEIIQVVMFSRDMTQVLV